MCLFDEPDHREAARPLIVEAKAKAAAIGERTRARRGVPRPLSIRERLVQVEVELAELRRRVEEAS